MISRIFLLASALSATAAAAHAHIALQQPEAPSGVYYVAEFRLGHGCEGAATTALRVQLPQGIADAKPQPKAGWSFEREGRTVTWRGRLPDSEFEVFSLLVKLPAAIGPIYFPTVQVCGATEIAWTEIPAPGAAWTSVPHPAPVVTLSGGAPTDAAPAAAGHEHH